MNQMNQMKMMSQMQSQMSNMSNNAQNNNNTMSQQSQIPGGVNVIFRVGGPGSEGRPPIMIQCLLSDRVSALIEKYRNKSGDRDTTKKFIFNAKNLDQSLTVAQAGINNNSNIFVVTTQGIKGAKY